MITTYTFVLHTGLEPGRSLEVASYSATHMQYVSYDGRKYKKDEITHEREYHYTEIDMQRELNRQAITVMDLSPHVVTDSFGRGKFMLTPPDTDRGDPMG